MITNYKKIITKDGLSIQGNYNIQDLPENTNKDKTIN